MSIQNLLGTQPRAESPAPAAGRNKPAGSSFQDQLVQTAAAAGKQAAAAAPQASAPFDYSAFMKDDLLSSLYDFKLSALDRMRKAKENEEEQDAWDKLMKYLDAWIESLRDEADVQKISKAHAALTALQSEADSDRKNLADALLEQLAKQLSI